MELWGKDALDNVFGRQRCEIRLILFGFVTPAGNWWYFGFVFVDQEKDTGLCEVALD